LARSGTTAAGLAVVAKLLIIRDLPFLLARARIILREAKQLSLTFSENL